MKITEIMEETKSEDIQELTKENYGQEAIVDIENVPDDFFNDKNVREFAETLCDKIGMTRGPIYLWGDNKALGTMHDPKADGISVCQFLHSSSITMHCIDELHKVFINVFSCNKFDPELVRDFAIENIGGEIVAFHNITRK